ncbi:MAG: hypothetical protein SWO11_13280, partial [Thermodesulfobacteriota bacterium]|nr:hypothetical protein [Thermodesulfobacteriota bacterium]
DRITLRSRIKVDIQWMLYCLVHNLEKISNFGKTYADARASRRNRSKIYPASLISLSIMHLFPLRGKCSKFPTTTSRVS